jgi:OHCU decarboxylase
MTSNWNEWLHLALRWLHVVAGIFWLGQTALFTWLDRRLHVEARPGEPDQVWMVHSGGFYVVERKAGTETMPRPLHWFKWEAALTWASGFFLLVLVYYLGGALVSAGSGTSVSTGVAVGLATLAAGWVIYDLLWMSPLSRHELAGAAVCLALLTAAAYGLTRVLSGRAAYLHLGALLGTIMSANVWMRILPAQRRMIAAVRAGRAPDPTLGARAKQRSKHNTFMALPVVFLMVSPHFPTTSYGHRWSWALLPGFVLAGFGARWLINRYQGRHEPFGEEVALGRLNHLPREEAIAALAGCCGCRRWAEDVAEARPFGGLADLLLAADGAFDRMDRAGWLAAFAAHPPIGGGKARAEQGAAAEAWSSQEQAGTRGADARLLAELAEANRRYQQRFGHVFLISAAGKSAAEILAALGERLGSDPESELDVAALEQRTITRLRLKKLLDRLAGEAGG